MIFIDTGYFSCAFGLILVHGLLALVSLGLSHFDLCFISTECRFFKLTGLIYDICFAFRLSVANTGN